MEIRQLRYFIAVADTLNYSRAAESLYISQAALSRQINELEKEIGLPLFIRNTRSVELTNVGKILRLKAKDLISGWEKILPEVLAESEVVTLRTLMIGVDACALKNPKRRGKVLEMIYGMRKEYSGIRILFQNRSYQEIQKRLVDRTLDGALLLTDKMDGSAGIEHHIYEKEEAVLVFCSDHKHCAADYREIIQKRELVLVDRNTQELYHTMRILNELQLEPQIRFCENLEDLLGTIEIGESASILPESVAVSIQNPRLQMLRLPAGSAGLYFSLAYRQDQENPMLTTFESKLAQVFSN